MKLKKLVTSIIAAAMCALSLTGCAAGGNSGSSDNAANTSSTAGDSSAGGISSAANAESTPASSAETDVSAPVSSAVSDTGENTSIPAAAGLKVVALKGPTAMGLTKLMDDNEKNSLGYSFEIKASPDEISPMVAQGTADIFCVPANLAAVLSNKTEGKVQVAAVNTLGVLYICEVGETVNSVADLKGKTIYSAGKGSTPEYALNFILQNSGLDPEKDVTIEWKSEHVECLEAMLKGENCVAMLPQPFVTTAQIKNEAVKVVLDLNKEWDALGVDSSLITGVAIVRKEAAEQNPEAVNSFLKQYKESVDFVNGNVDEAAELIGKYDIVPAAVAKKAVPNCNIVCITGTEMKEKLSGYLKVLFDNEPKSVGGTLPDDGFYYGV